MWRPHPTCVRRASAAQKTSEYLTHQTPSAHPATIVRLWQTAAAPRVYEALSRERMRAEEDQEWRARSLDMKPVEGPSEIDIMSKAETTSSSWRRSWAPTCP